MKGRSPPSTACCPSYRRLGVSAELRHCRTTACVQPLFIVMSINVLRKSRAVVSLLALSSPAPTLPPHPHPFGLMAHLSLPVSFWNCSFVSLFCSVGQSGCLGGSERFLCHGGQWWECAPARAQRPRVCVGMWVAEGEQVMPLTLILPEGSARPRPREYKDSTLGPLTSGDACSLLPHPCLPTQPVSK